jgi:hypothetical protein
MAELEKNIFMFGCWNKDNCGGPDYRQVVLDMVEADINRVPTNDINRVPTKYNNGIILGDNIYPLKVPKIGANIANSKTTTTTPKKKKKPNKIFTQETFEKLNELVQKCIPKLFTLTNNTSNQRDWRKGKKHSTVFKRTSSSKRKSRTIPDPDDSFLKVILGNHDEEDNDCIKNAEIDFFKKQNKKQNNVQIYQENTITECELCYYLYLNTNDSNRDKLKSALTQIIKKDTIFRNRQKWLLFIGHDPLFSFKYKKGKDGKKTSYYQSIDDDNSIIKLFEDIYKLYPKMVYLCADTHNFQILEVSTNPITKPVSSMPSNVSRHTSKRISFKPHSFNGSRRSFKYISPSKRPSASFKRPSASFKRPSASFKIPSASFKRPFVKRHMLPKTSYTKQFKIPIIICGTGGASLDPLNKDDDYTLYNKSYPTNPTTPIESAWNGRRTSTSSPPTNRNRLTATYNLNLKIGIKQYGYCSLKITENNIKVVFNSCNDEDIIHIIDSPNPAPPPHTTPHPAPASNAASNAAYNTASNTTFNKANLTHHVCKIGEGVQKTLDCEGFTKIC